tara:strand:+ start:612 stop:878 length:267 start_codon:yes stop_codon:yes gene_type:complete
MAFKMKNPFKQVQPSISESTSVQKPVIPVIKKPKKCYMTNSDGTKTEIPCKPPVEGKSGGGTVTSTTDANLRKMKKYTKGSKFIGIHG